MSAANCGEWLQAETWFVEAQTAAEEEADLDDMRALAVGLGADAGVAALEGGNPHNGLTYLVAAVESLGRMDASAGLKAAYCQVAVRHAVVWATRRVTGRVIGKDETDPEARARVEPGACSNPSPAAAVLELPLAHIDITWYLLAEADVAAGLDLGAATGLYGRLEAGPIPVMEVLLRGGGSKGRLTN